MVLAVRVGGSGPASAMDPLRTALANLDTDLPLRELQTASALLARARQYPAVVARLLSFLALLGLGLALLGVYGVVSRAVAQRTGEFGLRLALGARPRAILALVLMSGAPLAAIGVALGHMGGLGVSKLIAAGWPGMQTSSLVMIGAITLILLAVGFAACYAPARRASRISPIVALSID